MFVILGIRESSLPGLSQWDSWYQPHIFESMLITKQPFGQSLALRLHQNPLIRISEMSPQRSTKKPWRVSEETREKIGSQSGKR